MTSESIASLEGKPSYRN
uniref:Uncharacterized protein n=1 Tax=Anguilla anguilla TaxID=7936 RepID=A0A0E9W313_ANGAN